MVLPAESGAWREHWLAVDERDTPPVIGAEAANPDDWLEVVANGEALGLASAVTHEMYRRPGVVYRRVIDISPTTLAVACLRDADDEVVEAFMCACAEAAGSEPGLLRTSA